jgi:two-component system, cell cycle sensor histidine kinase and response regulator CckA
MASSEHPSHAIRPAQRRMAEEPSAANEPLPAPIAGGQPDGNSSLREELWGPCASEAAYRKLVENLGDALIVDDDAGRVVFANERFLELFGYTRGEIPSIRLEDYVAPHWLAELRDLHERRVRGDAVPTRFQYEGRRRDGTTLWLDVQVTPIVEAGRIVGTQSLIRDATDLKLTEAALFQSEERYRAAVEDQTEIICRFRPDGTVVFVNDVFCRFFGRTREELMQTAWFPLVHPDDLARVHAELATLSATNPVVVIEKRMYSGTGELHWKQFTNRGFYDAQGNLLEIQCVGRDITARKRAEEAWQQSEQLARSTLDGLSAHIAIVNEDGAIEAVNQAWRDFAAANDAVVRDVCEGANYLQVCAHATGDSADGAAEFGRALRDVLAGKRDYFELEYPCHAPGQQRWFVGRITRAPGAGAAHAVIAHQDVTERKQAVKALRTSEQRYRTLFDAARDAILIADAATGRIVEANHAAEQLLGRPLDTIIGMHHAALHPPEQAEYYAARFASRVQTGGTDPIEGSVLAGDGRQVPVEISANLITLPSGQRVLQGMFRDISERSRGEEARTRLATAIEQSAEAIVITDPRGTIQYVNPAFERITGYPRAEAVGQNPRVLKSGAHDQAFYETLWSTITSGQTWTGHFTNRRKTGVLYEEEATISPVLDAAGQIINYVAVKRDITQELAVAEQLRQAQKMEAVGQLAAGVAHDFNNLLTAICGYVALARQTLTPEHPASEALRGIESAAENAIGVTRGLLTFSGRTVARSEVVDLRAVLRDAARLLRHLLPASIALDIDARGETALWVRCDQAQLQQVLMNLAVNARDAMPNGGRLRVSAAARKGGAGAAKPDAGESALPEARIEVSDTGIGMSPEVQARIFEPFFTTKPAGRGTGLGLAIIHSILEDHGGRIEVDSAPGAGSTFRLYLPGASAAAVARSSAAQERVPPGQGEMVLLAEDDQHVRAVIAQVLDERGLRVITAADGHECWKRYCEHEDAVRLLVLDVDLPGRSGLDCLAAIRARGGRVPALVITAQGMIAEGVLGPYDVLLRKPFPLSDLTRTAFQLIGTPLTQENPT